MMIFWVAMSAGVSGYFFAVVPGEEETSEAIAMVVMGLFCAAAGFYFLGLVVARVRVTATEIVYRRGVFRRLIRVPVETVVSVAPVPLSQGATCAGVILANGDEIAFTKVATFGHRHVHLLSEGIHRPVSERMRPWRNRMKHQRAGVAIPPVG